MESFLERSVGQLATKCPGETKEGGGEGCDTARFGGMLPHCLALLDKRAVGTLWRRLRGWTVGLL